MNNTLYNIVSLINTAFFVYSKVLWSSPVPCVFVNENSIFKDLKGMQSTAVPCVFVNENSIFKDLNVMQSTAVWIALLYLLIFVFS